jgi:hypothetical protein
MSQYKVSIAPRAKQDKHTYVNLTPYAINIIDCDDQYTQLTSIPPHTTINPVRPMPGSRVLTIDNSKPSTMPYTDATGNHYVFSLD